MLSVFLALAALMLASDYEDAVALLERGNARAAIPLLERAAQANGKDAKVWKALGVAHASLNEYSQAEPAFGKACAMMPSLADACYYHGRALYALNRFEESVRALGKAPRQTWLVALAVGQAQEAAGNGAAAEKAMRQAGALCGGRSAEPDSALGLFLLRQGRLREAETLLAGAVERFPNAADARVQLGRLLIEKDQPGEALAHLETALRLTPNSAQAHLLLAKGYTRLGRAAEAKPHFEAAARLEAAAQGATQ